jgi:hypothetical protein
MSIIELRLYFPDAHDFIEPVPAVAQACFFFLVTCCWPDKQALQNAGFTLCIYSYLR